MSERIVTSLKARMPEEVDEAIQTLLKAAKASACSPDNEALHDEEDYATGELRAAILLRFQSFMTPSSQPTTRRRGAKKASRRS